MKLDYRWIGVLLLALAAGHWSGRWSAETAPEQEAGKSGQVASGSDARPSRSSARSSRRSQRDSGSRNRSRQGELDRILADFYDGYTDSGDPFASNGTRIGKEHPAWSRLCAWVMSASQSDFPGIMDVAKMDGEAADNPDVMNLLLQRWVELDPDSAVTWVRARQKEGDTAVFLKVEMFLVQEAVLHHPGWAAQALQGLYQKISLYNKSFDPEELNDPFGDSGMSMDFNLFFRRLSALPEAQRNALVSGLGRDVQKLGMEGWVKGMVSHGGEEGIFRMYQQAVESESMYDFYGAFRQYAARDWKQAREFVEKHHADSLDYEVWGRWATEDKEKANQWLLNRATDAKARENRIDAIADKLQDVDQQRVWIEQMESRGEPVAKALKSLVDSLNTHGRLNEAMDIVARLPQESQQKARQGIYYYAGDQNSFSSVDRKSIRYVIPNQQHEKFYSQYPEFYEYMRQSNKGALLELGRLMISMENDFKDIPAKAPVP